MLELKDIVKIYPAGSGSVEALKGVSLQFRKSEFVSILGPSGCGKTTMLNIIGGLDQYTRGDLLIGGRSTRDFKDRDWDAYRNHSIGFVFQSYNLIPHQTVLQNVELALTLSGVAKSERRRRAKEALEKVGLGDQLRKRPGELSGGQMQRVAIARAIVNDPEIILADEPTGALDTETSVQVMDILKEIAQDRLVIMVTHNPELAEAYSTRIIRMLDGQILSDTAPLTEEEQAALLPAPAAKKGRKKRPSMSLFTSFGLSLKNLFTKKGRTTLTAFAGSIGIIGIALIFAVSQGMTTYIDIVQEETLSSYPLTLEAQHVDVGTLLTTFMGSAKSAEKHGKNAVYQKSVAYDLVNALNSVDEQENDLASFKAYLEKDLKNKNSTSGLKEALTGVQYTYDLDLLIYTKGVDGTVVRSDTETLTREMIGEYMGMNTEATQSMAGGSPMSSLMNSGSSYRLWQEMLPGKDGKLLSDLFESQYDVVYGQWPAAYNEIVLVLDEDNELGDMTLYALGLIPKEDIDAVMDAAVNKTELKPSKKHWSYKEVCDREYRTVLSADCFVEDEETGLYTDLRETEAGLRYLYKNGTPLKVTGIIRPKEDALATVLTGTIGYTHKLTEYVIGQANKSAAVKAQKKTPGTDVFTGLPFEENTGAMTDKAKAAAFRDYVNELDQKGKAALYTAICSIPDPADLKQQVRQVMAVQTRETMTQQMQTALSQEMGMDAAAVQAYLSDMSDEDLRDMFRQAVEKQVKAQYAAGVQQQLMLMTPAQLAAALKQTVKEATSAQCAHWYDEALEFSDSTYEDNLIKLGCADLADPSGINLYASSFENKDVLEDVIAAYNDTVDDLHEIRYTDYVGIMMSSITTIINAITYVLIAFVAISLVVSSIMIGVITLISVQERTKEIGILRAIGASKRNVSRMFNAETVIIGAIAGLLGIGVTYLLCIPINMILHALTGIGNLSAILPLSVAAILVGVSILLTLIAGVIPSRSAARKDPVVALRTE